METDLRDKRGKDEISNWFHGSFSLHVIEKCLKLKHGSDMSRTDVKFSDI